MSLTLTSSKAVSDVNAAPQFESGVGPANVADFGACQVLKEILKRLGGGYGPLHDESESLTEKIICRREFFGF